MKSGISMNKSNEMINEGLASAGESDWTYFGKGSGDFNRYIYFDELPTNWKELLIICNYNINYKTMCIVTREMYEEVIKEHNKSGTNNIAIASHNYSTFVHMLRFSLVNYGTPRWRIGFSEACESICYYR